MSSSLILYKGGCHCGAVRFNVYAPSSLTVIKCNCSICTKKQNHHFIVPKVNFKLIKGKEVLQSYTFNTHTANHTFCSICGVQSFYTPRSNSSDGYGISIYCLDEEIKDVKIETFDGKKWEEEMKKNQHILEFSKTNFL